MLKKSLTVVNWIALALGVGAFLAKYIHPQVLFPIQFLPLLLPVLGLVFLPLTWWARHTKQPWLLASNGLFLLAWLLPLMLRQNVKAPPAPAVNDLKMVSYNVGQFQNDSARVNGIIQFLKEEQPDIICLQEFGLFEKWQDRTLLVRYFAERLQMEHYHFAFETNNIFGLAIFSRFPIERSQTIFLPITVTNGAVLYELNVRGQPINLLHFHLYSFNQANLGHSNWQRLKLAFEQQSDNLNKINLATSKVTAPLLMVGDLNNIPGSYFHHQLHREYQDSFWAAGKGTGWTFQKGWLGTRIDFQFASEGWTVLTHQVKSINFSDHYPVSATYRLN